MSSNDNFELSTRVCVCNCCFSPCDGAIYWRLLRLFGYGKYIVKFPLWVVFGLYNVFSCLSVHVCLFVTPNSCSFISCDNDSIKRNIYWHWLDCRYQHLLQGKGLALYTKFSKHLQTCRPSLFTYIEHGGLPSHKKTMLIIFQLYGLSNKTNLIRDQGETWSLGLAPQSWEPAYVSHLMCHDNTRQGVNKCSPPPSTTHVFLSEHQGSLNSPFCFHLKRLCVKEVRHTLNAADATA